MKLFLCGDVMTGRGIDQVLPHPSDPVLYESHITSARDYVTLAERRHGSIPHPVDFDYIWGDALAELETQQPGARIVNLETSVTASNRPELKGINYRMHPANVRCLEAANIDCCNLANNHVLDWGRQGLRETLETLERTGIAVTGAGREERAAASPAILQADGRRILVFGFAESTSGVPRAWRATGSVPGVQLLTGVSEATAEHAARHIQRHRSATDSVVVSIHWGGNWGYKIPAEQRRFAHRLIDAGVVDVIHGHSSHHPKGIEVYRGKLILYGCGDFITDYEGITGHERYRPDLVMAYFASLDPGSGDLASLEMTPFQARRFRLERTGDRDTEWLRRLLDREGAQFGTGTTAAATGRLSLRW